MYSFLADASGIVKNGIDASCASACNTGLKINTVFSSVTNLLIFLVGAISVIMIVIGGLRYVLSSGDSKAAADAKNTILYAVVGLVVAIAAYAIVSFVVTKVK